MAENFGAFVRRIRETGVVKLPVLTIDCSANPNYPAGTAGDCYRVSGAGKIGGASGPKVEIGDILLCHTTAASGNYATVGSNWVTQQVNLDPSLFEAAGAADAAQAAAEATAAADATSKADAAQAAAEATAAADATTKADAAEADAIAAAAPDATTKADAAEADAIAAAAADATTKADARMATDGSNAALPTSDPAVAGKLWSDAGTVKVSAGV